MNAPDPDWCPRRARPDVPASSRAAGPDPAATARCVHRSETPARYTYHHSPWCCNERDNTLIFWGTKYNVLYMCPSKRPVIHTMTLQRNNKRSYSEVQTKVQCALHVSFQADVMSIDHDAARKETTYSYSKAPKCNALYTFPSRQRDTLTDR